MKNKLAFACALSALFAAAAGPAVAAYAPNPGDASFWKDFTLSGNVGLASQYRFRGLMQTDNQPAIQGGITLSHSSGFYLGNWDSNISWLSDSDSRVSAPIEMDFFGGYTGKILPNLSIDTGVMQYYYPGDYPGSFTRPDTTELYLGLGYGPFAFKYSHALTNLFGFADSKNSQYYDLSGNFPTSLWGLMVNAHVGHQNLRNVDKGSYTDWSLGITKNWDKGFATSLAYQDTNADTSVYTNAQGKDMGKKTVILSLAKSF
jgi:uncharacterized protein (TIGR02001 family)